MTSLDYLVQAQAELRRDNKLAVLAILEEGMARHAAPELRELLHTIRTELRHLQDRRRYEEFYEKRQQKPAKYHSFGRRIERKIRTSLGIRTRKVVAGCLENPRYVRVEAEIRRGGFCDVLDVGCYEGHFSIALGARNPSMRVTGVDIATTNVEVANELNRYRNVRFRQGFAEDIDKLFPAESFDFIMLLEILEHVISVEDVLRAAFRVLKPHGRIAITVPADVEEDHHEEHVRFFSDELIQYHFGRMPGLVLERIALARRAGKPPQHSSFVSFTKPGSYDT